MDLGLFQNRRWALADWVLIPHTGNQPCLKIVEHVRVILSKEDVQSLIGVVDKIIKIMFWVSTNKVIKRNHAIDRIAQDGEIDGWPNHIFVQAIS